MNHSPSNPPVTFGPGILIHLPESLDLITPYVIREQGDWFEDEIQFVRKLLQPGNNAIDIGANYGLYSLSMAHAVGTDGAVWSFEPASSTAAWLTSSIQANGYPNITLDTRGLSNRTGTARLSLNDNSELNEIIRDESNSAPSETIHLTTLDQAMEEYGWSRIDFLKIDAEGEEAAIVQGGAKFFQTISPLVQYEVKAGSTVHIDLVEIFKNIGYESYRLVPSLGLLAPFDPQEPVDGYLLNLFCCKPDRADQLARQGLLVKKSDLPTAKGSYVSQLTANRSKDWLAKLSTLPYGKMLSPHWNKSIEIGLNDAIDKALSLHSIAADPNMPATDRYLALQSCLEFLLRLCEKDAGFMRLLSLARVAREYGHRSTSVRALDLLVNHLTQTRRVDVAEPFLAASAYFDSIDPGNAIAKWILGSALEELERSIAFSSFYTGTQALDRLKAIKQLGFGSPEMERRFQLILQRFRMTGALGGQLV